MTTDTVPVATLARTRGRIYVVASINGDESQWVRAVKSELVADLTQAGFETAEIVRHGFDLYLHGAYRAGGAS